MPDIYINGASSGIGRALAKRLNNKGNNLYLASKNRNKLKKMVNDDKINYTRLIGHDVQDINKLNKQLYSIPALDSMILCAGVCHQFDLENPKSIEMWHQIINVNLNGVFYTIKAVLPKFKNNGSIIIISSGLGKLGKRGYLAYSTSKHALLGLVKCLALELAYKNITVNAICPGWVDTPMAVADINYLAKLDNTSTEAIKLKIEQSIPIGRLVSPDEVAALIEFLLTKEARAITGEAYNISGGEFFA